MKKIIKDKLAEHIEVIEELLDGHVNIISKISESIIDCYKNDGKVILFGNGGSAADAQHIAGELVGRFITNEEEGLPAVALSTNTSVITAVANDYDYGSIFERQVDGLVNKGDIVIGISTSGNSENVIRGIVRAKKKGAKTIAFTGRGGGKLKNEVDVLFEAPSEVVERIQEAHITAAHIICELVDVSIARK